MTNLLTYCCSFIILFIILFLYCHSSRLKTINNDLKILQVSDPTFDIVYDLFSHRQPIIFQKELVLWKEINTFIGKDLNYINNTISSNKHINYSDYIKNNLDICDLPLSYDWNIDIRNVNLNETASIFFVKQTNYLQLIGCVSGEMRIIIAPPNQSEFVKPFINMVSTYDATQLLDKDPIEMNFIEIIVREGNMIYIPYQWIYFIYKHNQNNQLNDCVIIDCINQSLLNYL
jgi:hypothetical protein